MDSVKELDDAKYFYIIYGKDIKSHETVKVSKNRTRVLKR